MKPKRKLWVVGIDPSLTGTGLCRMNQDNVEDFEAITVGSAFKGMKRLDELEKKVMDFTKDASYVFIEGLAFGARGRAILDLAGLGNVLRLSLFRGRFPYWDVPPTVLKKYVTTKGNANKNVVLEQCFRRFGKGSDILKDDNQVDAFCLVRFGISFLELEHERKCEKDFKKHEAEAFKKIGSLQVKVSS